MNTPLPNLILSSGLLLALASLAGRFSLVGLPFTAIWLAHLFVHLLSFAFALKEIFSSDGYHTNRSLPPFVKPIFTSWIIVLLLTAGLFSALPITSRDALIYHLTTAKQWLLSGHIVQIPWLEWSYFPLLQSVSYAGFLRFHLEPFTGIYHGTQLILVAGLASHIVREIKSLAPFRFVGIGVFLTLPLLLRLTSEPLVDLSLGTYTALALYFILKESTLQNFILSGLALGVACSLKYNGIVVGALLLLLAAFLHRPLRLTHFLALGFAALLVYLPWPLANFHNTGNPVYPFFQSIFLGGESVESFKRINPLEYRLALYHESFWDVLCIPFRMVLFGADGSAKTFDGVLSPLLLLLFLAPLSPLVRRGAQNRTFQGLLLFALFYYGINLVLFDTVTRYLTPLFLPFVVAFLLGMEWVVKRFGKTAPLILSSFLFLHLAWSTYYLFNEAKRLELAPFLRGQISKSQFIEHHIGSGSLANFVNRELPSDARVLLLYTGNRYYLFDREVRGSYFSGDILQKAFQSVKESSDLLEFFQKNSITHIAWHRQMLQQALPGFLTPLQLVIWNEFLETHAKLVQRFNSRELVEISRATPPMKETINGSIEVEKEV